MTNANNGAIRVKVVTRLVTMTNGQKSKRNGERPKPTRLNMMRRKKKRKKRKKRNPQTLSLNLVQQRRRTPPQERTNSRIKNNIIPLSPGLVSPVSGMKCDPCLRDRGG